MNVRDSEPDPYLIPLSLNGAELLSLDTSAVGGWAAYFGLAQSMLTLVRVGPAAAPVETSPLEVREIRFAIPAGSSGFSSGAFREIPVTRIEAAINHPAHRAALLPLVGPPNMMEDTYPAGVRFRLPPDKPVKPARPRLKIDDPGGYRKPDSFYRVVADRYLSIAALSQRPAQELADVNGMPVATVHRWIREAKARGLLLLPSHRGGTKA